MMNNPQQPDTNPNNNPLASQNDDQQVVGSAQRPDNLRFLEPGNHDGPHPPNEFTLMTPQELGHLTNDQEAQNLAIGNPMDPKNKKKGGFFYRVYKGTLKGFGYTGQV